MRFKSMINEYLEVLSGFYGYKNTSTFNMCYPQVKKSFEKIVKDDNLDEKTKKHMIMAYYHIVRDLSFKN